MAIKTQTNCCTLDFTHISGVCDCIEGFQIAGFAIDTDYFVSIETSKGVYSRTVQSDNSGLLTIPFALFPERLINRFGGNYYLSIDSVTFDIEKYSKIGFAVSNCESVGYYQINKQVNL